MPNIIDEAQAAKAAVTPAVQAAEQAVAPAAKAVEAKAMGFWATIGQHPALVVIVLAAAAIGALRFLGVL